MAVLLHSITGLGLLVAISTTFIFTSLLTPIARKIAFRFNILDKPCSRKIHSEPVAYLGGLAIFGGLVTGMLTLGFDSPLVSSILIGSFLIVLVGFIDDVFGMSAKIKFLSQVLIATYTAVNGIAITSFQLANDYTLMLGLAAIPFTVFWIVGMINTVNLIDGMDGLASGISGIAAIFIAVIGFANGQVFAAALALMLAASCFAFLRFNFSPATIFLGDTGSLLIGYLLGVLAVIVLFAPSSACCAVTPLLVLGFPITDTTFAILRRIKNRQGVFSPDSKHLHHRLLKLGLSQREVAVVSYIIGIALGSMGLMVAFSPPSMAMGWFGFTVLSVVVGLFMLCKRPGKVLTAIRFFL